MSRDKDDGGFITPTPRPDSNAYKERWKGREKGARRGRDLKQRMDKARAKHVRQPRDSKGKGSGGCAVAAVTAVGAATVTALRAKGWLG